MIHRLRAGAAGPFVAVSTALLAAVIFVACGGGSGHTAAPPLPSTSSSSPASPTTGPVTTTSPLPDVAPTAASFVNINTMTRVGDHFVGSLNGHLAAALAVARSKTGGVYPVGTVIQLIPTEAMVKRHAGYSPSTGDWEFFSLAVSTQGTQIKSSGASREELLRRRLRVVSPQPRRPGSTSSAGRTTAARRSR